MIYVTVQDSADMAALHQKAGVSIKELKRMFPQYRTRTIYRHANSEQWKPWTGEKDLTLLPAALKSRLALRG